MLIIEQMYTEIKYDNELNLDFCNRFWYENEYMMYSRIKCLKCDEYTCYGTTIDCDGNNLFFYECKNCMLYYAVCFDCQKNKDCVVKLSRLVEHHNYNGLSDGDGYVVTKTKGVYCGCNMIRYLKSVYFYDEGKFGDITGPDGGYESEWKCDCSTRVIIDK